MLLALTLQLSTCLMPHTAASMKQPIPMALHSAVLAVAGAARERAGSSKRPKSAKQEGGSSEQGGEDGAHSSICGG